jgi:hypothetical protein
MSKFVDELLKQIYNEKDTWKKYANGTGIEKSNIKIYNFGNTKILSVVSIDIEGQDMPLTYMDRYKLEKAIGWWYKNISLERALV